MTKNRDVNRILTFLLQKKALVAQEQVFVSNWR